MHHTAAVILQLLEERLSHESAEEQQFYRKLERLVSHLGIEAAELEAQAALYQWNQGIYCGLDYISSQAR